MLYSDCIKNLFFPPKQKENLSESSFIRNSGANLCRSDAHTSGTNITLKSFTCAGGEVETSDRSDVSDESVLITRDTLNNTSVTHEDTQCDHEDHPYCRYTADRQHEDHVASGDQSLSRTYSPDLTFKSFTCPGGEVEIAGDESIVCVESVVNKGPDLENATPLENEDEVSDEHTEPTRRHFDHPYYYPASELKSEKMEEEEDGDGGSVNHGSIFISKSSTDITFKSFTCPGGEVEIADESVVWCESLMKRESLVQDESLIHKDSEVHNLLSEACDECTKLPSRLFDHQYCNGERESIHVHSATRPATLDANDPEGVVAINDSSTALTGSTEVEGRESSLTFCFSGAEVEIEDTNRIFDMSVLMKGLNMYDQVQSSPHSQLSEHGGESIIIGEKDDHIYCHGVKNDPEVTVSENGAHLRVQMSNSGGSESSESAVRNEGSKNMKSELIVPESSSDTTEVQNVKSVQQQGLDQQTSANLEEHVLMDESLRRRCDVFSEENGEISHSQPSVGEIPESTAEIQNCSTISQNANDGNVTTNADPEILRSESVDVEAQLKMWSHIVLSEPSTPKHSHFWLSESPIPPPQLHSTVLTAPLTPKPAPASDHELQKEKVMKDFSAVGTGPLQEQLRKMGELLIAASGKISTPAAVTPVKQHSACVWTSPKPQQERSTNTSAIVEERKEVDVSDACTSTDSLLWR